MTSPTTAADLIAQGETGSLVASAQGGWGLFDSPDIPAAPAVWQLEQMLRSDGKGRLLEQALTLPLRGAKVTIEPPQTGEQGQTDWCREHLLRAPNAGGMRTPLSDVIGLMASATWQRRATFEKVWGPTADGRVGYLNLAYRPTGTVSLLRDPRSGLLQGVAQQVPKIDPDGRAVGTERIVLSTQRSFTYLHGQHRDPLGGTSDLDLAWLISDTKRKIRFLWWKFLEQVSFPSATISTDKDPSDTAGLTAAARRAGSLRSGGVLPLAAGESLAPYDSNGQGASQFQAALDWLSSEQSASVLAGFSDLTGPGKVGGSYALSVSATDLFTAGRDSVLREMGGALTSYVVADLVRWNFGAGVPSPVVRFAPLRQTDLTEVVTLLQALARESANSVVPQEFVDELTVKVAGYLELNVDKIAGALNVIRPKPAVGAPAVAQLAGTVDRAARLVMAKDAARAA